MREKAEKQERALQTPCAVGERTEEATSRCSDHQGVGGEVCTLVCALSNAFRKERRESERPRWGPGHASWYLN